MREENGGPFEGTRRDMQRAIRRLDTLEYVILLAVVVLALAGGGLVAWVLSAGTELPFRLTWGTLSLLLLVVPGLFVLLRDRGEDDGGRGRGHEFTNDDG